MRGANVVDAIACEQCSFLMCGQDLAVQCLWAEHWGAGQRSCRAEQESRSVQGPTCPVIIAQSCAQWPANPPIPMAQHSTHPPTYTELSSVYDEGEGVEGPCFAATCKSELLFASFHKPLHA